MRYFCNSSLPWCDEYYLHSSMWFAPLWVTAIEAIIGMCTIFSHLVFLKVLSMYKALHANCRFLMMSLAVTLLLLTSVYMVELTAVVRNITLPERGDIVNHPFIRNVWFIHESCYALTSLLMFCITIERLYAGTNAEKYSRNNKLSPITVVGVLLSILGSLTFGYFIHFRNVHIPTTSMINSFEIASLSLCTFTHRRSSRVYRNMIPSNLNYRYQMDEVISLTDSIIPAIIFGVVIKLLAMTSVWCMIFFDSDPVFYSEVVSIYGLVFPWIVMLRNNRMHGHLLETLHCGNARAKEAKKKADRLTRSITQDEYFEMLDKSFESKKASAALPARPSSYVV